MRLLIVADDLTGALDSAAPAAGRGANTRVVCRPDRAAWAGGADVVAHNLDSRHLAAAAAALRVRNLCERARAHLAADSIAFKKIDSTLRGPFVAEVMAMAHALARPRILFAPAVLEHGRTMRAGHVHVGGAPLGMTSFARDALAPAPAAPVPALFADGRGDQPLFVGGPPPRAAGLWVPDIEDEGALVRAAAWALDKPAKTLCVGAAGLATVLAHARFGAAARAVPLTQADPVLFVIGSRTAQAAAQIEALRRTHDVPVLDLPAGWLGSAPPAFARPPRACVLRPTAAPASADVVARNLAESVVRLLPTLRPGALVMAGGDTAQAVLAALAISTLTVKGAFEPGVAVAHDAAGASGLTFVTKAGGFGRDDLFASLLAATAVSPAR